MIPLPTRYLLLCRAVNDSCKALDLSVIRGILSRTIEGYRGHGPLLQQPIQGAGHARGDNHVPIFGSGSAGLGRRTTAVMEIDAGKYSRRKPVIVQEGTKILFRLSGCDQTLLV